MKKTLIIMISVTIIVASAILVYCFIPKEFKKLKNYTLDLSNKNYTIDINSNEDNAGKYIVDNNTIIFHSSSGITYCYFNNYNNVTCYTYNSSKWSSYPYNYTFNYLKEEITISFLRTENLYANEDKSIFKLSNGDYLYNIGKSTINYTQVATNLTQFDFEDLNTLTSYKIRENFAQSSTPTSSLNTYYSKKDSSIFKYTYKNDDWKKETISTNNKPLKSIIDNLFDKFGSITISTNGYVLNNNGYIYKENDSLLTEQTPNFNNYNSYTLKILDDNATYNYTQNNIKITNKSKEISYIHSDSYLVKSELDTTSNYYIESKLDTNHTSTKDIMNNFVLDFTTNCIKIKTHYLIFGFLNDYYVNAINGTYVTYPSQTATKVSTNSTFEDIIFTNLEIQDAENNVSYIIDTEKKVFETVDYANMQVDYYVLENNVINHYKLENDEIVKVENPIIYYTFENGYFYLNDTQNNLHLPTEKTKFYQIFTIIDTINNAIKNDEFIKIINPSKNDNTHFTISQKINIKNINSSHSTFE